MTIPDVVRFKIGATRLGIALAAYQQQREAGQRWCSHHAMFEAAGRFGPNRKRVDGFAGSCREALREYARVSMARLRAERRAG